MSNLHATSCGGTLSIPQRLAIRTSLLKLKMNENLENISFWGKIHGTAQDYFIAQSIAVNTSVHKLYYWSNDGGLTFAKLPELDDFIKSIAPHIRGLFTGNPTLKYRDPNKPVKLNEDGEPEESETEDDVTETEEDDESLDEEARAAKKAAERKLNELERLAYQIRTIDHDTAIVPKGQYYMTATGEIQQNHAFKGLSIEDSRKIVNYLVLRTPQESRTLAKIRGAGVSNNFDFLDSIVPHGANLKDSWSLHTDETGLHTHLRSLVWPGYEYHLEALSNESSGAYFGWGEKNGDLAFML